MRKLILLTILIFLRFSVSSQINPFDGIFGLDSCEFESPCNLLKTDTSSLNIWQIGCPGKPFFDTAYTQPYALVTDTINPYPPSNHSYFDLIIKNNYDFNIIIDFRHKFQTDTLIDGGYIEISYDKGQTWMNIIDSDTTAMEYNTENMYSMQDTLKGGINGFSGTSDGWIYSRVQWVWMYMVKEIPPDTLIMRFHFISDSIQTNKEGWMIDNIIISYAFMVGSFTEKNNDNISIKVVPNPFDNFTTIHFENFKNEMLSLFIFNQLGQIVQKIEDITDYEIQIEKGTLKSGVYVVQLRNKHKIYDTAKMIVK